VVRRADRFNFEMAEEFQGVDVRDPKAWNRALEDAFARESEDERRAVKKGS